MIVTLTRRCFPWRLGTKRPTGCLAPRGLWYHLLVSSEETESSGLFLCPSCGSQVAPSDDVRFCPRCGQRLGEEPASRHVFGVLAPGPAFVLGCVLLVGAILAGAAGSLVVAIVLAVLGAAAFVLFYGAAERDPTSPVADAVFTSGRRVRGWALFGRESADAWAHATRDVARLRVESRSLRQERKRAIVELGEAAHREDAALVGALRLRLREIDEGLAARREARVVSVARARRRVQDERVAAQPTQTFSVDELTSGEQR